MVVEGERGADERPVWASTAREEAKEVVVADKKMKQSERRLLLAMDDLS